MAVEMINDRYLIVKVIGEGGMARVYLAIDSILKREVAVKVLRGEMAQDSVNLKRFEREAIAISNMSHPNIVEIYDVGEDNKRNFIVMEYVHGRTLKELIKDRGALNQDEAVNIMKQLVSATAHAHRNGVIHRDIKSQNVLIKDDGTVKLSDFGIAQVKDEVQLTQTNTVMGSVHYLAPEIVSGKAGATAQSDIYSLGIVFYEMLTGTVPFHGEKAVEIALKHIHEEIPSVCKFNPMLPQSIENIVIRSTAKDPADRYATADEMYDDLVTCLDINRLHEPKLNLEKRKLQQQEEQEEEQKELKKKKRKKVDDDEDDGKNKNIMPIIIGVLVLVICMAFIMGIISVLSGGISEKGGTVTVPDVSNYTYEHGKEILEKYGLKVDGVNYQATEDVDSGLIVSTNPASGAQASKNTLVTVYVSSGTYFTVENYQGKDIEDIKPMLLANGFKVNVLNVESATEKAGTILSQNVSAGTVLDPVKDSRIINLEVASAVSFMIPYSIKNMDVDQAVKTLSEMGALVELKQMDAPSNITEDQKNIVISTSPSMGTYYTQSEGRTIIIYYY